MSSTDKRQHPLGMSISDSELRELNNAKFLSMSEEELYDVAKRMIHDLVLARGLYKPDQQKRGKP